MVSEFVSLVPLLASDIVAVGNRNKDLFKTKRSKQQDPKLYMHIKNVHSLGK